MHNHNIAARVLNQALLLEPGYARVFLGALAPRLGVSSLRDEFGLIESQDKLRMRADAFETDRPRNRPYEVITGIAVVPVSGTLVHKFGHLRPYSGMTGYDGIIARIQEALADTTVKGILMDLDTPGGEVAGCFDTAKRIAELRGVKPIGSISYDMACSAGMAIHSAADYRYTTTTARTGSVGVVMMHASFEEQLKANGIDVTLIHSGAFKVDGNPYENLPERVLRDFQAESDRIRAEFAAMVAGQIGLSESDVLATEAAIYTGQDAIEVGFADELINGHDMLAAFSDYIQTTQKIGVSTMTVENQTKPAATAPAATPEASTSQAEPVDTTKLTADAAANEQARIAGILQAEEAEGKTKLAQHLAFKTQMSVDDAKAALAAADAGEQKAAAPTGLLSAAMGNTEQPQIGADAVAGAEGGELKGGAKLAAAYQAATGAGKKVH
jgi:ClpP class serine protease